MEYYFWNLFQQELFLFFSRRPVGHKDTGVETTFWKAQCETATCQMDRRSRQDCQEFGCRWHRTGHAGNQLGKPMFSSGQQQADMMMMGDFYLLHFICTNIQETVLAIQNALKQRHLRLNEENQLIQIILCRALENVIRQENILDFERSISIGIIQICIYINQLLQTSFIVQPILQNRMC